MASALGIPLPRASEWDPTTDGEGKLDPLGLSAISDRIASTYANPVRARMRRLRFVTASCLGATIARELAQAPPAVPGDSAELAFERVLVECMAHANLGGVTGIPGIAKARGSVRSKQRLDLQGYLKSPRVFGFHGVYRPLVLGLGAIDGRAEPLPAAQVLLDIWLAESAPLGQAKGNQVEGGARLYEWALSQTSDSLTQGRNAFGVTSGRVRQLAMALRPDAIATKERSLLRRWLHDPSVDPVMPEVLSLLLAERPTDHIDEAGIMSRLAKSGSQDVKVRVRAVMAFEDFARDIELAFDTYRYLAATNISGTASSADLSRSAALSAICARLRRRYLETCQHLTDLDSATIPGGLTSQFVDRFASFGDTFSPQGLIDAVMDLHQDVQGSKPPSGKRPWADLTDSGWAVRPLWYLNAEPTRPAGFPRPYRIAPLLAFLGDLDGG